MNSSRFSVRVLFFPVVGLLTLALAYAIARADLQALWQGRELPGEIVATLIRAKTGDARLAERPAYTAVLRGVAGWEQRGAFLAGGDIRWDKPAGAALAPDSLADARRRFTEAAVTANRSGASVFRRYLLRANEHPEPIRLASLEIEETLRVSPLPANFVLGTRAQPSSQPLPLGDTASVLKTRLSYAFADPTTRKVSVEAAFSQDGAGLENQRHEFFLFRQPSGTIYLPVIRCEAPSGPAYLLSDIGRYNSPHPSLTLGARLTLHTASADGSGPLSFTAPAPKLGSMQPLLWVSLMCEAVFSRWAYPFVLTFFGVGMLIVGAIQISLIRFRPGAAL